MAKLDVTYAYAADITKTERDPETGVLRVYGKATGPDLDLDEQICDPGWLKSAMPGWMEWGNIREMHGPAAAGIGTVLDEVGDDWMVGADIIDPTAALKCETKVYKGYSIGIKNARVVKDTKARGGRIVGGEIVEVSLVDRPCNPTAKMSIAKGVGLAEDGLTIEDTAPAELEPVEAPEVGDVEPNGDTVVEVIDAPELDASAAVVEVKSAEIAWHKSVSEDILRRVRRIVPAETLTKAAPSEDIATAQEAIGIIARLIQSEAEGLAAGMMCEASQISCLLRAVDALQWFQCCEAEEPPAQGSDGAVPDDIMTGSVTELAAEPDPATIKTPEGDDSETRAKSASGTDITDIVKAAITEVTKSHEAELATLRDEITKLKALPLTGGPVLARPRAVIAEAGEREASLAKVEQYTIMAKNLRHTDPQASRGYAEMAEKLRASIKD